MMDLNQEIPNENLTQKDIMQFLLHSTQHAATREELEIVRTELKQGNIKLEDKISKVEVDLRESISKVEVGLKESISKVEVGLKESISKVEDKISKVEDKISKVESSLREDISKVGAKFDKLQWFIVAAMITVLFKDYIASLIK